MFYRTLLLSIFAFSLSACNFTGTGEKGPFNQGANVTVSKLDQQASPISSKTIRTTISDNQGHYSANDIKWNGWFQITISGPYFNEFSNSNSPTPITLNTITRKDRKFDRANVNLFTHFAAARIKQLVANGDNRLKSWRKAQTELKRTFGLKKINRNVHHGVEQLSLSRGSGRYRKDNANLLLFSGSFQATSGDASTLNALTTDFADDGVFNGAGIAAFNAIARHAGTSGLLTTLSNNLKSHGASNPPNNGDMPNLPKWVIEDAGDTTPPTITITGLNPTEIDVGSIYEDAGATATDDVDGEVSVETTTNTVDTTTAGSYEVIYTAIDSAGNEATATRIVNVNTVVPVDTTPPVITLLGNNPDSVFISNGEVPEPYNDPGATVSDDQATPVAYEVIGTVDTSTLGEYTLVYTATDDALNIATPVERIVNVVPYPNQAPTANNQDITLDEDGSVDITLTAADANGDTLTYSIVTQPSNGSLSATASANTYTYNPAENFNGTDSFAFKANDGQADSNTATVSIIVNSVNDQPTANAGNDVTVVVNNSVTISGSGSDIDGDAITYAWYESGNQVALSTSASFEFSSSTVGTHTLTLVVEDTSGATASDSIDVEVTTIPESIVAGSIVEANGNPLIGVTVSVFKNGNPLPTGNTPIQSNGTGNFEIPLNPNEKVTLQFYRNGFATQVLPVKSPSLSGGRINLDIMMVSRDDFKTLSGSTGGTATSRDGASVTIAPNSFVDQAGAPVTDDILISITPVNVATPAGLATFPGEFSGIMDGSTTATPIVSYGTVEYTFIRQSGEKVQLADGQTATILIPMYIKQKQEGGDYIVGDSIALWSLDETTGIWQQEGTGTVVESTASPTGLALQATVSHFTWWNCDVTMNPAHASITVLGNQAGTALIKARTNGNIGYRPNNVDTVINVGETSSPLSVPSNGQTCFWAEISFIDGSSGNTAEQCFTPSAGESFSVVLSLSNVELAIGTTPATTDPVTGNINFAVEIIKIRPLTIETAVSYAITGGALPAGLSLSSINTTEANITGTPTEAGDFTVEITATDSDGNTSTKSLTYSISSDALQPPKATGKIDVDVSFHINQGTSAVGSYILYNNAGGKPSSYSFVLSPGLGCTSLPPFYITLKESTSTNPTFNGEMMFFVSQLSTIPHGFDNTYCIKMENAAGLDVLAARVHKDGQTSGLTWQDDGAVVTNSLSWDNAVNYCSNLVLNGSSNWRLPLYSELSRYTNNGINHHPSNRYWSRSTSGADYAWFHDYNVGDGGTLLKTNQLGVRCVEGFPPPQ